MDREVLVLPAFGLEVTQVSLRATVIEEGGKILELRDGLMTGAIPSAALLHWFTEFMGDSEDIDVSAHSATRRRNMSAIRPAPGQCSALGP